jgi:hypothetical protein
MITKPFRVVLLTTLFSTAVLAASTETVFSTYRIRKGMEAEFATVHAATWAAYRKYKLVLTAHHTLVKGKEESGAPFAVEILTWTSADAPDNAPAEIKGLWAKLEALCEKRDGHRGIEFVEMEIVDER